jgi:UDP-N-acetylmuramate dehydrogenase
MNIQHNIPLHDKNWFRTGGPARFYCEPTNASEFAQALAYAREHNLELFILGEGANILMSDTGFNGLVIRPSMRTINEHEDGIVVAGAGASIAELITWCLSHNLLGLEEFSGIPGSVGGAVYINLHYFEFFISHFLLQAEVICKKTGEVLSVTPEWFNFGYNTTTLHNHDYFLISATFKLKKSADALEVAFARGRSHEIIRQRSRRYPTSHTCGSFFRNFHKEELPQGKTVPYVAYYLDKVGVKGELSRGAARVSHHHANMLVNTGDAKSADIIALACEMQSKVHSEFGVLPHPECLLIGFENYPLLKL